MKELEEKLEKLKLRFEAIAKKLDQESLSKELLLREAETLKSDFWGDVNKAQSTMQKIADIRTELDNIHAIEESLQTFKELL